MNIFSVFSFKVIFEINNSNNNNDNNNNNNNNFNYLYQNCHKEPINLLSRGYADNKKQRV